MRRSAHSLIGIACALLAACSSVPVPPPIDLAVLDANADSALARGDYATARAALEQLVQRTDGDAQRGYQIDLARAEIGLGTAEAALIRLDGIVPPIPDSLRPDYMAVRAEALFALGSPAEAVRLLVEREIWLDTPESIRANHTLIWDGLRRFGAPGAVAAPASGDATIDGWLALTPLTRLGDDEAGFLAALLDWQQRYPNHPAATGILAERLAALRGDSARPNRVALLLPLGGDGLLRLRAEAIRDGVFAAHLSSDAGTAPEMLIYDTASESSLARYQAAQLAGADFIIGPLRDTEVDAVLPAAGFVPTLALNFDTGDAVTPGNFFEFALSSSDEIEAIASRSIDEGKRTAVILHASNDRGYRLMNNFRDAFESRGGRIIATRAYIGESSTSGPIEEVLGITQSQDRFQRLQANLGLGIEFEPRRRADIDMIFLQADPATGPADASLLMPLLRGENAGDITTYATPDVYDPARERGDADLDGLIFPDIPLLIDPVGDAQVAADLLVQYRSRGAADYPRLFAFGYDAYRLAEAIYASAGTSWTVYGATGQLYVGENGRIRRIVPFAQFSNGQPRAASQNPGALSQR
jgi:outer membrane PBP1 activator LpoA protein